MWGVGGGGCTLVDILWPPLSGISGSAPDVDDDDDEMISSALGITELKSH